MTHRIKWTAKGKKYQDPASTEKPDNNIDIPESEDITMPDGKNIYGEPVDARQAIFYIRYLWERVCDSEALRIYENAVEFINELNKENKSLDESPEVKKFLDKLKLANSWLVNLLDNSFAITIDKSTLLKTLSQPECTGVRFYLALKDKTDEQKKESDYDEIRGLLPYVLTLVTVGVDCKGNDLHYEFDPNNHSLSKIPEIGTASLSTEYPKTPKIVGTGGPSRSAKDKDLKPYVLYLYAYAKEQKDDDKTLEEN